MTKRCRAASGSLTVERLSGCSQSLLRLAALPPDTQSGREVGRMSAEENKTRVRQLIEEIWNQHDAQALPDYFAPTSSRK
jgi:hypothetical protein